VAGGVTGGRFTGGSALGFPGDGETPAGPGAALAGPPDGPGSVAVTTVAAGGAGVTPVVAGVAGRADGTPGVRVAAARADEAGAAGSSCPPQAGRAAVSTASAATVRAARRRGR
jgi:hypothetical protein